MSQLKAVESHKYLCTFNTNESQFEVCEEKKQEETIQALNAGEILKIIFDLRWVDARVTEHAL